MESLRDCALAYVDEDDDGVLCAPAKRRGTDDGDCDWTTGGVRDCAAGLG